MPSVFLSTLTHPSKTEGVPYRCPCHTVCVSGRNIGAWQEEGIISLGKYFLTMNTLSLSSGQDGCDGQSIPNLWPTLTPLCTSAVGLGSCGHVEFPAADGTPHP